MKILGQRDSQWANQQLGTSDKTIGSHGCTITCIAMASGLTPTEVNNRFNANGVYTQGNLVTWTKIQGAIPWLQFEWRGYTYENDKVKGAIDKNGFCLVEVDGSRIGGGKHWVLYIGGGQMYDPWYGNQKATSYYLATGYAIINKVGEPQSSIYRGLDLSNQESMKVCVDDHLRIVEGSLIDKTQYESVKGQLTEVTRQNESLSDELGSARASISAMVTKIEAQNEIIRKFSDEDAVQIKELRDSYEEATKYRKAYTGLLEWVREGLKLPKSYSDSDEAENEAYVALGKLNSSKVITKGILDYKYIIKIKEFVWKK